MSYETEGIRYTGSKKSLLPNIHNLIKTTGCKSILDGFAGSTRVGQMLSNHGYIVTSNDLSDWSKVFGECYLSDTHTEEHYSLIIEHLNNIEPEHGWFSETYGGMVTENPGGNAIQTDGKKRPWQLHNTQKLDAIREEIDRIAFGTEKSVLLTSLILALDKVDNGLGHQVAYLKEWSPRSYNRMILQVPKFPSNRGIHTILKGDIKDVKNEHDLVYLDPPYGTNNDVTKTTRVRYASYYHLWSTVIKNDRPLVKGASLRRDDVSSDRNPGAVSIYENTDELKVAEHMRDMLENLNTQHIIFSYNNKGRVSIDLLTDILSSIGKIKSIDQISHKENIQKKLTINKNWLGDQNENYEYLFLVEK
jgi:adenine-specific DNA-methyltransferase